MSWDGAGKSPVQDYSQFLLMCVKSKHSGVSNKQVINCWVLVRRWSPKQGR